jgi:hypothetical protein
VVQVVVEEVLQLELVQNPGGTGNTPPVSPSQGNPWWIRYYILEHHASGGGGGGASAPVGTNATPTQAGSNGGWRQWNRCKSFIWTRSNYLIQVFMEVEVVEVLTHHGTAAVSE